MTIFAHRLEFLSIILCFILHGKLNILKQNKIIVRHGSTMALLGFCLFYVL